MSAPERETIAVDVETRFGRVQAKVAMPKTMRLSELAYNVLPLDEQLVAMATRADEAAGNKVACSKGCGACCRQLVPLSPPEAWFLADLVRSFPAPRQKELAARFAEVQRRMAEARFDERTLPPGATMKQVAELAFDFFELGLACPFLEDEACSIHPNRPTICREFLITTPAPLCADLRKQNQRGVPMAARMSECLAIVAAELLGTEVQVIPMPLAIDWARAHAEEGQRRFETKPMLERFLELVNAQAAAK